MGKQRAHRKQLRRMRRSQEIIERYTKPIGDWRPLAYEGPAVRSISIKAMTARLAWDCTCQKRLRASGVEPARGALLACDGCGQLWQSNGGGEGGKVRPVLLDAPEDALSGVVVRIPGTSSAVCLRSTGISISLEPGAQRVRLHLTEGSTARVEDIALEQDPESSPATARRPDERS